MAEIYGESLRVPRLVVFTPSVGDQIIIGDLVDEITPSKTITTTVPKAELPGKNFIHAQTTSTQCISSYSLTLKMKSMPKALRALLFGGTYDGNTDSYTPVAQGSAIPKTEFGVLVYTDAFDADAKLAGYSEFDFGNMVVDLEDEEELTINKEEDSYAEYTVKLTTYGTSNFNAAYPVETFVTELPDTDEVIS